MQVLIMRHGEASMHAPTDALRPLTKFGVEQAKQVGMRLSNQNILPEYVLVSRYLRAQQTFENVHKYLNYNMDVMTSNEIIPSGNVNQVVNTIYQLAQKEYTTVLIVSHLPLVGYLIEALCEAENEPLMFATADVACVQLDAELNGHLEWHGSLIGK